MLDLCIFLTWFRLEQWTTRKLEAAVWNSKLIYGFVDHKHSDFRFTIRLLIYWSRVDYLWIIVMFLSTVWTIILTAPIHCRGSIGEKRTHLRLGWPNGEYIFSKVLFLGEFIIQCCFKSITFSKWMHNEELRQMLRFPLTYHHRHISLFLIQRVCMILDLDVNGKYPLLCFCFFFKLESSSPHCICMEKKVCKKYQNFHLWWTVPKMRWG